MGGENGDKEIKTNSFVNRFADAKIALVIRLYVRNLLIVSTQLFEFCVQGVCVLG